MRKGQSIEAHDLRDGEIPKYTLFYLVQVYILSKGNDKQDNQVKHTR